METVGAITGLAAESLWRARRHGTGLEIPKSGKSGNQECQSEKGSCVPS